MLPEDDKQFGVVNFHKIIDFLHEELQKLEETDEPIKQSEYKFLEFRCKTEVTDEDMLRLLIDQALKDGDKEKFLELSRQLNDLMTERVE